MLSSTPHYDGSSLTEPIEVVFESMDEVSEVLGYFVSDFTDIPEGAYVGKITASVDKFIIYPVLDLYSSTYIESDIWKNEATDSASFANDSYRAITFTLPTEVSKEFYDIFMSLVNCAEGNPIDTGYTIGWNECEQEYSESVTNPIIIWNELPNDIIVNGSVCPSGNPAQTSWFDAPLVFAVADYSTLEENQIRAYTVGYDGNLIEITLFYSINEDLDIASGIMPDFEYLGEGQIVRFTTEEMTE
jgi:hypothetical protein